MPVRALIADDDPTSRRMLELVLGKLGYDIIAESNGQSALDKLTGNDPPQIAILDWMMPQLDGPEVVRRVRARADGPYIYMLLLTSKTQSEDVVRGLESGADDYILKPFNINELRARLRSGMRVIESQQNVVKAQEALRAQAAIDPATGLFGPATLFPCLARELARNRLERRPTSIIMIGVESLRAGNIPRDVADKVVAALSKRVSPLLRPIDALIRAGDGVLCAVVPYATSADAQAMANQLRDASRDGTVTIGNTQLSTAISIGTATTDNEIDATKMLNAARQSLVGAPTAITNQPPRAAVPIARPPLRTERTA